MQKYRLKKYVKECWPKDHLFQTFKDSIESWGLKGVPFEIIELCPVDTVSIISRQWVDGAFIVEIQIALNDAIYIWDNQLIEELEQVFEKHLDKQDNK